ncbi:hypothetical protein Lser_V15G07353 [Lactuca serriola]
MGDPIVSSVVNQVMERSTSLAAQDFAVLWGLKSDLRSLRTIFTQIQAVLADAEVKQRKNRALQDWLRKLRAASFEVENVLEEVSTEALLRRLHVERGIKNRVSTFFSASNPLQFRIMMVQKVKDIKELLNAIASERIMFELEEGINISEVVADIETRIISSIDSEIVGRDEEKEVIIDKICTNLNSLDHDHVHVYAIWGVGGLGKTTLAQLIFNDSRVNKLFDFKVWLRVSNDFSIQRLAREFLKCIEGDSSNLSLMELEPLQQRLQEKLQRRRFLLVLDDVKNENNEEWNGLMQALRCGGKGSAILVTTQSMKLADTIATLPSLVHPLGCLSESDSWLLFKHYAFGVERELESTEFETIGKAIVKKCEGLPLALKVIGSLMCLKTSISNWLCILQSEVWELTYEGTHTQILPSLKLSYDNLPPHMRQCFALCSIFPKHHEMDKQLLVELWVAYGFVPSRGDSDLYDLGEEIFNALVWRSFLQDVKECIFEGVTTCKMHDEMHNLAQSVMKYECSSIMSGEILKFPEEVLHLSSNDIIYLSNEVMAKAKSLRSLITFEGFSRIPTPDYIFEQRYLRVLHLGSSSDMLTDLPESVGNLKFLRYLNVSRSKIAALPNSIVQLQNLQTLKLTFCENLSELPEGIRYMRNLRHLNIHGCCSLDHMPLGMGQLRHLRRLSTFLVGQGVQVSELQELNLLGGEFSIKGLTNVKDSFQAQSANLKKKQNINCLNLSWNWKNSKEDNFPVNNSEGILEALQPHLNLKMLTISDYPGSRVPYWMGSLVNLVSISFEGCRRCESLSSIGKLPSLKVLELKEMDVLKYLDDEERNNRNLFPCLDKLIINECPCLIELPYIPKLELLQIIKSNEEIFRSVKELNCLKKFTVEGCHGIVSFPSDWFQGTPDLRSLSILDCLRLESLEDGLQRLKALEELQIMGCPNLRCLPDGLQNLEKLKSVVIGDCEMVKVRCETDVGEDWSKIVHLPYVKIDDQVMQ